MWSLNLIINILIRYRKKKISQIHQRGRSGEYGGRDWDDASISQGMPRIANNTNKTKIDPSLKGSEALALPIL